MRVATRVAWELEHGVEPSGIIRHTCDNKPCVNIHHLINGSYSENVVDMHERNENCRVEGAHSRRLTYAQVDEMRRIYRTGTVSADSIAATFNVAQTTASNAISGRSYKRGPSELPAPFLGRGRKVA